MQPSQNRKYEFGPYTSARIDGVKQYGQPLQNTMPRVDHQMLSMNSPNGVASVIRNQNAAAFLRTDDGDGDDIMITESDITNLDEFQSSF